MSKEITEEMGIHKEWLVEAKTITAETLPAFIKKLTEDYNHDYGTIVHAIVAAAIAAANAVDKCPSGGITGFQASCIMWKFIQQWMHYGDTPLRLVNYEHMLYPQYGDSFEKTISPDTWQWLQGKAAELLKAEEACGSIAACNSVKVHWQSIVDGFIPFGYTVVDMRINLGIRDRELAAKDKEIAALKAENHKLRRWRGRVYNRLTRYTQSLGLKLDISNVDWKSNENHRQE